jgi:hypothetical protein
VRQRKFLHIYKKSNSSKGNNNYKLICTLCQCTQDHQTYSEGQTEISLMYYKTTYFMFHITEMHFKQKWENLFRSGTDEKQHSIKILITRRKHRTRHNGSWYNPRYSECRARRIKDKVEPGQKLVRHYLEKQTNKQKTKSKRTEVTRGSVLA